MSNQNKQVCPQVDPTNVDPDGMPLAPSEVLTSPQSAWSVFSCAEDQATSFHVPTAVERQAMTNLLQGFYTSKQNGVPSVATTKQIMDNCKILNLQVCRVKNTKTVVVNQVSTAVPDNVLLFYTIPGVKDYSGPFMMLRETKSSRFVIYTPHNDSDGTFAAGPVGMMKSYAVACFLNGHKRGNVSGGNINLYRESDWAHASGEGQNLGDVAIANFANQYPGQVSILFNGDVAIKSMVHSRNPDMLEVFQTALMANSRITANDFTGYSPTFTTDNLVNTNYYIKCEIPTIIYENNYSIIADIVIAMEQNLWCWPA